MKSFLNIITLAILMALTISCSDNGSNSTGPDEIFGSISMTVTGAIDAVHECDNRASCVVSFGEVITEIGSTTIYTWQIEAGDFTTFLPFGFSSTSFNSPVNRPAPGSYTLGSGMAPSFEAGYSNIEGGLNDDFSFETTDSVGGTLVIETSTSERVTGSFEFDAIHIDEGDNRTITVTGTFEAINEELLEGL